MFTLRLERTDEVWTISNAFLLFGVVKGFEPDVSVSSAPPLGIGAHAATVASRFFWSLQSEGHVKVTSPVTIELIIPG